MFDWLLVVVYLAAIEVMGLAFLPACARLFGRTRGAGVGFARTLGLLAGGYCVWLGASLHAFPFGVISARVVTALVVLGAGWWGWRRWRPRGVWREWLWCEGIFFAFYALFFAGMWTALASPWGERTLDLALMTAIENAAYFPPDDTWFLGHKLNYYYYGHFLGVYLGNLVGVTPLVGYCLFWPLLPALLAVNCFSLLRMLIPRARGAALYGAFLITALGNLSPLRDYFLHDTFFAQGFMYQMTRVIPGTINETPGTAFLIAEVHAHAIVLPLSALFLALCFNWLGRSRNSLAPLLVLAFVFGAQIVTNSWDLATHGFLLLLVLAADAVRRRRVLAPLGSFGLVVALSFVFYAPFHYHFKRPPMQVEWLLAKTTTRLGDLFIHPGFFFIVLLTVLAVSVLRVAFRRTVFSRPLLAKDSSAGGGKTGVVWRWSGLALLALLIVICFIPGWFQANAFLFVCLLLTLGVAWPRLRHAPQVFFTATLAFGALCILWGCELLNVRVSGATEYDRENTVYRFYMPVWLCLGVLTAVAMNKARLLFRHRLRYVPAVQLGIWTFALASAALVFLSLLHPVVGSYYRGGALWNWTRLDATAHLQWTQDSGRAHYLGIQWLRENAPRDAVVVEPAGIAPYGKGVISMGTGRRTICTGTHKLAQRGYPRAEIERRKDELALVYQGTNWESIEAVLRKYGVQYVVHPASRSRLPGATKVTLPSGQVLNPAIVNWGLYERHAETVFQWPIIYSAGTKGSKVDYKIFKLKF